MPTPSGCPCGAHVATGVDDATEITTDLLELLITNAGQFAKYSWLAIPWIGTLIGTKVICSQPQVDMPTFEWSDLININVGKQKLYDLIANKWYELGCECDDCPPAVTCGTPPSTVLDWFNGYQVPDVDPPAYRYHIPIGAEIFVTYPSGSCSPLLNGLWVYWNFSNEEKTEGGVNVRAGDDIGPGAVWDIETDGTAFTIWLNGPQVPPSTPVPEPPDGWPDYSFPQPCTNSDICASLAKVEEMVHRMEFLVTVLAGPQYGLTTPITATIPGGSTPITGTIFDFLQRAIPAIAPVTPAQLVNPVVEVVTEPTYIDVTGLAYINIVPTVVPATVGYRGEDDTAVYYSNHRTPGPGWAHVLGEDGVLEHRELLYPVGVEFVLPGTATGVAIELAPGVEVTVTTWERAV